MEIRSVTKALRLLDEVANSTEVIGISELARRLDMDKASVSRMIKTLEKAKFVEQEQGNQGYTLGVALIALGQKALKKVNLRDATQDILRDLAVKTGECAHVAMLAANKSLYLDQFLPKKVVTVDAPIGTLAPLHCTALGKCLLAYQNKENFDELMKTIDFEVFTRRTITDEYALRKNLEEVKLNGYALDDEEFSVGVRCIAAPVFNHEGKVIGALGVSGPSPRVTDERLEVWESFLLEAAREVSQRLGFFEDITIQT